MYERISQFVYPWSCFCFSVTGSSLASYCLRSHITVSFKFPKPRIRYMTDDVPNCVCCSDCLLVFYVLVSLIYLLFVISLCIGTSCIGAVVWSFFFYIELHVLVLMYVGLWFSCGLFCCNP